MTDATTRNAVLEEAAKRCDSLVEDYKFEGMGAGKNRKQSLSDAAYVANKCAVAIRALKAVGLSAGAEQGRRVSDGGATVTSAKP